MRCPQCKTELTARPAQCPRCKADLSLLADLIGQVESLRARATQAKSAGQIGPAIEAYLQMLEIDPTDAEAKEAVGQSVRAIRTVLKLEPHWLTGISWLLAMVIATSVLLGYYAALVLTRR